MTDGAQTDRDLQQLWSHIVFNLLVSNTDDHLRNHGFLLVPGKGWTLSPAFDMNPTADAHGLKLNISEADNAMDLELAFEVAPYFRVRAAAAAEIVERQADRDSVAHDSGVAGYRGASAGADVAGFWACLIDIADDAGLKMKKPTCELHPRS